MSAGAMAIPPEPIGPAAPTPIEAPAVIVEASATGAAPIHLSGFQIACFAGAALSTQLIEQPINFYLPQLYAKELGIGLAAIGLAVLITQTMNAISQQIVGFLSDRTRTRWGARKPWMFGGAIVSVIAAFFLLRPPAGVGVLWFVGWKIVYDFAWASKNVAYTAWGAELSSDYRERNRIMGAASFASQTGYLLNETLPIVVFALGLVSASTYSMSVLGYYFVLGAFAIPAFHAIALLFVPKTIPGKTVQVNWRETIAAVRRNGPFLRYLGSFILSSLATGVVSITFTFYDGYLKVGNWFPYIMTAFSIASLCTIPFWVWVCNRIGKHRAYAIAISIGTTAPLSWFLVDPATWTHMQIVRYAFCVVSVIGVGLGCSFIASTSILADVADYGVLKTGTRRTASYFAFYLLATKISIAIGSGLAYLGLATIGYKTAAGAINTPSANLGILCIFAVTPGLLSVPAAMLMWGFPLSRRRHAIIQRRLAQREVREARTAA